MGRRVQMPERESNLLLTSGLILLISCVLAAVAFFAFTLEIIDPPVTSDAPSRRGSSSSDSTGIANPDGTTVESGTEIGNIIYPGFVDFSITSGKSTVDLFNDSSNPVSFTFTIRDAEDQILYSVSDVQPGQSESWNVTEAYEPGTGRKELTITTEAFGLEDGEAYNGVSITITVNMG